MTGVIQSRRGGAALRRERRARGECVRGCGAPIFKGGRCRACYETHLASVNASYVKKAHYLEMVDGATYARIRREVIDGMYWLDRKKPKKVARLVDERLRREGLYIVKQWRPSHDRREENQALSELTVNRKTL